MLRRLPGIIKAAQARGRQESVFPFYLRARVCFMDAPPRSGSQQWVPQRAGIAEFKNRSISLHTFVWLHLLLPTMPTGSRVRTRIEIVLHTLESIIVCQTVIHLSSIGCFVYTSEAQVDKYVNYTVSTPLCIITVPLSMVHNRVLPHLLLLTFYFMGNVPS